MSNLKKCLGKESFQRMNYLYQISNLMATENSNNNTASIMYTNLLIGISKKCVQRLDIDLKRTICKGCRCILLSGINCKVRIKKKQLRWTCNSCRTVKTFNLNNRNYIPWPKREESLVEMLDYGKKSTN